jgi:hypothetical protein
MKRSRVATYLTLTLAHCARKKGQIVTSTKKLGKLIEQQQSMMLSMVTMIN